MIVDANLLLHAVDENSTHNAAAAAWLEETLDGDRRVGLPWQTIGAFLRIVTHPRVTENPLPATDALAVEHGVEIASADTDFMRFPGLRWNNPLEHV